MIGMPILDVKAEIKAPITHQDSFTAAVVVARAELPQKPKIRIGGRYKASSFAYGNCTYYAAKKRNGVDFLGNGGQWLANAKRAGYKTGKTPIPGAIIVTSESGAGHVGIVEKVNGNKFTISEMNYKGYNVVSKRTLSLSYKAIKGFIY